MLKPNKLQIDYLQVDTLKSYDRKLRSLPDAQIKKTKRLIEDCGLVVPLIIDKNNVIIVGDHILAASIELNVDSVPVVRADHLTDEQTRILRIAHDRIIEEADWNKAALAEELMELQIMIPDLTITGFEIDEINLVLDILPDTEPEEEVLAVPDGPAVTASGDLWVLGEHRLYCGDALADDSYHTLLSGEKAQMVFTDPPYNVKIDGHVGNSGAIQHREFAMASGEMTEQQFTDFLTSSLERLAGHSQEGAVIFTCMDWRHQYELIQAAKAVGLSLLNLCVWVKNNGGMGSLYRSRHELIYVFKNGAAKHINNVELGKNGRYRTNVWEYPGVNAFGAGRMDELKMHPTVKPTEMVADALKDCSCRGSIILDPFGGSGTTLIAAEKTGRNARLIELDPLYCDVTIQRWQGLTGQAAHHAQTNKTFEEIQGEERSNE